MASPRKAVKASRSWLRAGVRPELRLGHARKCDEEPPFLILIATRKGECMVLDFVLKNWGYLCLLIPAAILLYESMVVVDGNEIALIERKWFGSKMPQGRVVALRSEEHTSE